MIFVYIFGPIALLLVVLVVLIALQESDFHVTRSAAMSASPSTVFELINDFHKWDAWSPWAKIDPSMKQTYEGAPAGKGAIYTWVGNSKVGEGRMTIVESRPAERICIQLDFIKPFKGTNMAEFTFKPEGDKTVVTWSMTGKKNFILKAMGLFMNMDKMLGGNFEQGLAQMKALAEAAPTK
jgi:hypothetical protein